MSEELRECPFCGYKPGVWKLTSPYPWNIPDEKIACFNCGVFQNDAKDWNKRAGESEVDIKIKELLEQDIFPFINYVVTESGVISEPLSQSKFGPYSLKAKLIEFVKSLEDEKQESNTSGEL